MSSCWHICQLADAAHNHRQHKGIATSVCGTAQQPAGTYQQRAVKQKARRLKVAEQLPLNACLRDARESMRSYMHS
jgi:hypothetical protein